MSDDKPDFKASLNLPATDFPMRASLNTAEPKRVDWWRENRTYENALTLREGKPRFVLHDGPPYANGDIHVGHVLNKVLKDIIVKSKLMSGYYAPYVPGWDCHGLPIELKAVEQLKKEGKTAPQPAEIRAACRAYAEEYIGKQRDAFKRLGILGRWDSPYLTMDKQYEADTVRALGRLFASGIVYRGKKPVYWSWGAETALAEAEVEYEDVTSPAITVRFSIPNDQLPEPFAKAAGGAPVSVLIWTTTPWTLLANKGVAFHPDFDYAMVADADNAKENRYVIVAESRLNAVFADAKAAVPSVVAKGKGTLFDKKRARHPFLEQESLCVNADYVTDDAGTGCVHIAPGHGMDDYFVGLKYGLDIFAPVSAAGLFATELKQEDYIGRHVLDGKRNRPKHTDGMSGNDKVIDDLRQRGALFAATKLRHSYPHCWRTQTPVIFRATDQWFIAMDKPFKDGKTLRQLALESIEAIQAEKGWIPAWGRDRIHGMIANRPDWCISRQRFWGVPITVAYCDKCGHVDSSPEIFSIAANAIQDDGLETWWTNSNDDLLKHVRGGCKKCGYTDPLRREFDILDVWVDSGVSHEAVLRREPSLGYPADMYLEGSDQHRGWFHSSLLTALGMGQDAPYKTVLTHGFVVDGDGNKMSKSKGNVVDPKKIWESQGAEILRLWVATEDYRNDVRISPDILKQVAESYRRIRNTIRYMLGNIGDYDKSTHEVPAEKLVPLDRWMLHRLNELIKKVSKHYENYNFHRVVKDVQDFCVNDLSAIYLDITKDRVYVHGTNSDTRRAAQSVLYEVCSALIRLIAPVMSFTAEEAFRCLIKAGSVVEKSVFEEDFPISQDVEVDIEAFNLAFAAREHVLEKLEEARRDGLIGSGLDAQIRLNVKDNIWTAVGMAGQDRLRDDKPEEKPVEEKHKPEKFLIVSRAVIDRSLPSVASVGQSGAVSADMVFSTQVEKHPGTKCDRCWHYDDDVQPVPADVTLPVHGNVCPRCREVLRGWPNV